MAVAAVTSITKMVPTNADLAPARGGSDDGNWVRKDHPKRDAPSRIRAAIMMTSTLRQNAARAAPRTTNTLSARLRRIRSRFWMGVRSI